jgi:MFS transporter, ACS family, hexuronate transporter
MLPRSRASFHHPLAGSSVSMTQVVPPAASAAPVPRTSYRWTICGLLFFSIVITYIDRQIIGLLKPQLSAEFGWSESDYANIAAGFQFAYAFGYLFGGRLLDWLGVKLGLPLALTLWSIVTAVHASFRSVGSFVAGQIALGLTQGGSFPGAVKTVSEWFPVKERALATGLFNLGSNTGAIICPLLIPWVALQFGWKTAFLLGGSLGIVWLIAWVLLFDYPEKHRRVSVSERDYIRDGQPPPAAPAAKLPWRELLRYRAVWAYLLAGILAGPVWGFYLFFLPDFLQKRFSLSLSEIGLPVAMFYAVAAFGGVAGGWLSSHFIGRGWSVNAARKTALLICALCVVPVFTAPFIPNLWVVVLVVGLAGSAHQGWSANLFTFVSDTMPKGAVSTVVGMGGFMAYFTGSIVAKIVGWTLEATGNYVLIFVGACSMYLLALTAIHLLVPKIGVTRGL